MILVHYIPLYWGVETDAADRSLIAKTWLMEDLPPYRESVWAFRIRVSHRHWFHVGKYRFRRDALHSGLYFKPTEIGKWGRDVQEDSAAEPSEDEVRPDDGGRLGDGVGDDAVTDGGTVQGLPTPGSGSALADEADGHGDRSGAADHSGVTA